MKKTWHEKLEDKPSFPKVLRLEKGVLYHNAVREIRTAWQLSIHAKTLLYLYGR